MSNFFKNKKGNVIHRTTSETLRLGDDILNNPSRAIAQGTASRKKTQHQASSPICSFQITGVSLTRYDYGDDSADDLDESHTDDISRITDNETPSFSEDSRDTDDPQQIICSSTSSIQPLSMSTEDEMKTKTDDTSIETVNIEEQIGRFKISRVESSSSISRGRWTCLDYKDEIENQPALVAFDNKTKPQQSDILKGVSKPDLTDDDSANKNIPDEDLTGITPISNCQESYYSGSTVMPNRAVTSIFPLPTERPSRRFLRYSADIFPSRFPFNGPARNLTPSSLPSKSENFIINAKREVLDVVIHNENSNANEIVTQKSLTTDQNKNSSASGYCTATIDTKIEHALDVVKNHLTHAVRMEVEELKIKINELVDRITYLEYENDVLRANAAPEVLANLDNISEK